MKQLYLVFAIAVMTLIAACQRNTGPGDSLLGIKDMIAMLDSSVSSVDTTEHQGFALSLSDTLVGDIMMQYFAEPPRSEPPTIAEFNQQQRDNVEARRAWAEFKRLCEADQFEQALEYYLADSADPQKKHADDIHVFLKNSGQQHVFYSRVLLPLVEEYKGKNPAAKMYVELLQMRK